MTRPAERRRRNKGRTESGSYLALPHAVLRSEAFRTLSAHAVKLLLDIAQAYRGNNNGDLAATWRLMQPLGWKSRDTLPKALRELIEHGLIELTRQGGINRPSLYALTWRPIDLCQGKLDVTASRVPSGAWKAWGTSTVQKTASTLPGATRHAPRGNEGRDAA